MNEVKDFKNIYEVFKRFQKDRHNEDKGKNFNTLQEVYADTELFDTTKLLFPAVNYELTNMNECIVYNSERLTKIALPFSNQFIHAEDKQYCTTSLLNTSTYIFLREYSPIHITGTVYQVCDEGRRNLPFTINTLHGTLAIGIKDYDMATPSYSKTPFYSKNELFNLIINTVTGLDSLSDKQVLSETPLQERTEYFRRKGDSAIKVSSKKIHYVLKKNDNKSEAYIREHSTGNIEYSHAFKVRGHWRVLESIESTGKNRNGERCVKGYTWVTNYIKGDGELVRKIREIE